MNTATTPQRTPAQIHLTAALAEQLQVLRDSDDAGANATAERIDADLARAADLDHEGRHDEARRGRLNAETTLRLTIGERL